MRVPLPDRHEFSVASASQITWKNISILFDSVVFDPILHCISSIENLLENLHRTFANFVH